MNGGFNSNPSYILHGGNIKEDIIKIINPLQQTLKDIKDKSVNIRPAKLREIESYINIVKTTADKLEHAEKNVQIYRTLLQRFPNQEYITDYDYQDEVDRLEKNKKNVSKHIDKINSLNSNLTTRFDL
jgi:hypothetical protein